MLTLLFGAALFSPPLSFADALAHAPETPAVVGYVAAAHDRAAEAEGMRRLTDNPVLQVQPGVRDMQVGGSGAEIYVSLHQPIALGGKGKLRKQTVREEVQHDNAKGRAALREARLRIADEWLQCWAAQAAHESALTEVELASELTRMSRLAVAAGERTRVELAQFEAWDAEAQLAALAVEGERYERALALAERMGVSPAEPPLVTSQPPPIDLPEGDLAARLSAQQAPNVRTAEASVRVREAQVAEQRSARRGSLGVGGIVWREGAGDMAAVATLEVTLPVFDRGKRETAEARAALALAEQERRDAVLMSASEYRRLLHELEHTQRVLQTVEGSLLRAAERLAEAQRLRLEAQEVTARDWVLARRDLLRARLLATRARAAHLLARFRLNEALREERL